MLTDKVKVLVMASLPIEPKRDPVDSGNYPL